MYVHIKGVSPATRCSITGCLKNMVGTKHMFLWDALYLVTYLESTVKIKLSSFEVLCAQNVPSIPEITPQQHK